MQLDYTFERQLELEREESYLKGREEGHAAGREELIASMLCSGKNPDEIVSFTGVPMNEVERVCESMPVNTKESGTEN